jgi:olefin beta-lactone synthetase
MNGKTILRETWNDSIFGAGYCVGKPVKGLNCAIIKISDDPIEKWDPALILPEGEIGEICFKGSVATKEYYNRPDATKLAKISDNDGRIWHRMGDMGYLGKDGRIWFCGRKSHRVEGKNRTWYPIRCEPIYNEHPDVARSALVGIGKRGSETPAIIIEPKPGKYPITKIESEAFKKNLIELGLKYSETRDISIILFHPSFPVDIRHNVKIHREKLKPWAEKQMR